jgi:hypothetical protein
MRTSQGIHSMKVNLHYYSLNCHELRLLASLLLHRVNAARPRITQCGLTACVLNLHVLSGLELALE